MVIRGKPTEFEYPGSTIQGLKNSWEKSGGQEGEWKKTNKCLQSATKYLDTGEVSIQVWHSIDICFRFYM